ncbi:FAD/NAD(P)-binding protein [Litoribacter ruber]|uniref:FAD/NAD(P)-binding protein n=1 Tax=Litoribacter ruber TaxID=702568 RepID=A0AAP2G3I7_9BACT|nr:MULTISPECIES: FAD/NAD(P)-binding protein [Litoribacter]MBS9523490.1 FAD/NAD(P)-binding protein [Litoribacter alkaliphilus]MBT0812093.1 FAD/NAD(P)-binding protein [Litoribacter ruber]
MKNICIIGGGACGVAAFIELFVQISTQKLEDQLSITIIEKSKKVGYGLAFGTTEKSHLLNTQAELMGIFADEVEHFSEWLHDNAYRARGRVEEENGDIDHAYTSRILYGDYLHEQFASHLKKAKSINLNVELVCDRADDIEVDGERFKVILEKGNPIQSDYVILALGNPEATNFKDFQRYPHFINSPWPAHKMLEKIDKKAHVGILGTSLSSIDAVVALMDHGHEGKISLFSPEGMLPRVQPIENNEIVRSYLTLKNVHMIKRKHFRAPKVKELFRLFMRDAENVKKGPIDWKEQDRLGKKADDYLAKDIELAENGGDAILNVAYSLRYDAAKLWSWLSEEEKNRFKKWLGPHWAVNRHGMPLSNAKRLKALMDKGVLTVHAEIGDINPHENSFEVEFGEKGKKTVDNLINATGSPSQVEDMDCTLTENLLKKQLIHPYPSGGILVNELTLEAINKSKVCGIYGTGHLLNGMMLDVNAVWYNVRSIAALCQDILFKARYGENC